MTRIAPLIYLLLLGVGIPWYWPADNHALVLGMPAWVVIAIVVSLAASCLSVVILTRPWPGESDSSDE